MIINQSSINTLTTGFRAAFTLAYAQFAPEAQWNKVAMRVPSTTKVEEYGWLGMSTGFREWVGDRVMQALSLHGYSIRNKTFENTVSVNRDDIEDDQYGVYKPLMEQLGQDAAQHRDKLVFTLLKDGFTTQCYDGQFFFDTDHPVRGSDGTVTTVSNSGGGSGAPWFLLDTRKVLKPLVLQMRREYAFTRLDNPADEHVQLKNELVYGVDARLNVGYGLWQLAYGSKSTLDATAYNTAFAALQAMKKDNGDPMGVMPNLLVVGPSLRAKALEIVKAERDAAGATNINLLTAEVLVTPWLT